MRLLLIKSEMIIGRYCAVYAYSLTCRTLRHTCTTAKSNNLAKKFCLLLFHCCDVPQTLSLSPPLLFFLITLSSFFAALPIRPYIVSPFEIRYFEHLLDPHTFSVNVKISYCRRLEKKRRKYANGLILFEQTGTFTQNKYVIAQVSF